MSSNEQRIALITGGNRGLGESMARHLTDHGVDVIITYRGGEAEAQKVVAALQAKGRKAAALQLEVGDSKSFDAFAQRVREELARTWKRERLDFLVNNAGHGLNRPFADTSEADFDALVNVDLKG